MAYIRSLLILGRVSNLPTVWANCLTGWILTGNTQFDIKFWLMQLSATFFYLGGMYWNDAFDVEWDKKHAPDRPIVKGVCPLSHVWILGGLWFLSAFILSVLAGFQAILCALLLFATILWYDWIHKRISWSPVIMAGCRFWLIIYAGAIGASGNPIPGYVIWTALFLFCYVVGLSYIARHERLDSPFDLWPAGLLAAPILWAFIFNDPQPKIRILFFVIPFIIWTSFALVFIFNKKVYHPGRTVSYLLAGMVIVDLLSVQPWGGESLVIYLAFFALCLILQKWIPAT